MLNRRVAVVGLGHVGLPIAIRFATAGIPTAGLDTNSALISQLAAGQTGLAEEWSGRPIQELLRAALAGGALSLAASPEPLAECTDAVVTVGVPASREGCDLEPFRAAVTEAVRRLPAGALLLVRSTLPAGTMEDFVLPLALAEGRRLEDDLFVAYSPERMAEGVALAEVTSQPLILAAAGEEALRRARDLLTALGVREFAVASNLRLAELAKAVENASRDIDIAFANEIAALCRALEVDSAELVRLVNTHPRVKMLSPGPGVGGFCLPNAYHYLDFAARPLGVPLPLAAEARRVNDAVPGLVAGLVEQGLARRGRQLAGAKVAVLGVAMKDFCDDDRLSPAYDLLAHLARRGAACAAYDPLVTRAFPGQVESEEAALAGAAALVIAARQAGLNLDPAYLVRHLSPSPVIVDTRHCLDRTAAEALGCLVLSI
ncbi:MAG: nucleotide sugar dehydrogenase [Chitinophagales bacterium]